MRIASVSVATLATEVEALRPPAAQDRAVVEVVAALLADVRARGDAALVEATARFDWPEASAAALAVPAEEPEAAYQEVAPALVAALQTARDNCTFFHSHELRPDWEEAGPQGQKLGIRYLPVARAGLYVPGGLGSYASTVIMNAVPALVAGVAELIICTPPGRDGRVNRSVLAAARLMGIDRVFRVGGAQAVAAMAYGTETIPKVDVICGPGNAYVTEAKRQVFGSVGIDNLAGPSEVIVVADRTSRPEWVAADLLAQEEHSSGASALLVAESEALCREVDQALVRLRAGAARAAAGASMSSPAATAAAPAPGAVSRLTAFYPTVGEDFLQLAAAVVDTYAPEHLEIQVADARGFLARVRSAGAVFLGSLTATAFGDYVAGTNHVLPTGGSARFSSGLSVDTFMRRSSYVEMTEAAARLLTPRLAQLADSEGFTFHRVSAEMRSAPEGGRSPGGHGPGGPAL